MLEVKGRATVGLAFVVVAAVLALGGWAGLAWVKALGMLWLILCLSLIVSGAVLVLVGVFKAFDRRPLLIVDASGVHDRATSPARRFTWEEIKGFRLSPANTRKPQVLAIDVVDPPRAIREAPLGARTWMQAAELHHGSPCILWLAALDIEPTPLLGKLRSLQLQHTSPRD